MYGFKIGSSCVIEKNGEYLLVTETKRKIRGLLGHAGGKVEESDGEMPESLRNCAEREALEELGKRVSVKSLINLYIVSDRSFHAAFFAEIVEEDVSKPELEHGYYDRDGIESSPEALRHSRVLQAIIDFEAGKSIDTPSTPDIEMLEEIAYDLRPNRQPVVLN